MLQNVEQYWYPGSREEALEMVNSENRAIFIAGGTGLALSKSEEPKTLVDLTGLGLNELEINDEAMTIGATASLQQLIDNGEISGLFGGYFERGIRKISSYPLRNAGTVGGSLARAFPWSDVIPMLMVLDSEVVYFDGSEQRLPLHRLYGQEFKPRLNRILIERIVVNIPSDDTYACFKKFSRSGFDVAGLNLALRLTEREGLIKSLKVAVGARPMSAALVPEVGTTFGGQELEPKLGAQIGDLIAGNLQLKGDNKLSAEYRAVQAKRMAELAYERILSERTG